MQNYTPEQIEDIKKREAEGLVALKALNLTPAISMQMVNIGNDTFGVKPIPYLQDTKFTAQPSPLQ